MSNNSSFANLTIISDEEPLVDLIFTVVYSLIIIMTFIGCSIVLILFYMERKQRKIAHNYVISMCISDIFHGCGGSAVVVHYINGLYLGDNTCHIETAIMMTTAMLSQFCLVTTAFDRFFSIVFPLKYRMYMSHQLSYGLIASGWILGTGFGFGLLGFRSDQYLESPKSLCLYLALVVDSTCLNTYIPFLMYLGIFTVVTLYLWIYIELRRVFQANLGRNNMMSIVQWVNQKREKQTGSTKVKSPQIGFLKIREVRVTLMMFITMIIIISCWLPVMLVVMIYRDDPKFGKVEMLITYGLTKIYAMINPIFYAYTLKEVQQAFKRLISKITCH